MDRGLLVGIGPAPDKKIGLVMIVYSNERSKRNKIKGNYFVTFSSNNRSLGSGEAFLTRERFMMVQRELNMKIYNAKDYTAHQLHQIATKMKADVPDGFFTTVYSKLGLPSPRRLTALRLPTPPSSPWGN